ncbi:lipid-A-disaccharide synthase [Chroococcidiopsis sp. CCNUC1]|uniref:lipid-A-disaccharide synthase n=1 Tax=Chroococcidiopsis sp. CCNUC1 TaxID=2653189 RepID=UPI0020203E5F|nr:lipid-A-disaccharide synthase [Chroococcidiopsis sp. CCNUC1]URD52033.1 lipid-A-disaccharide synthase [Chroococcidiopsis sp. CCNUC1]
MTNNIDILVLSNGPGEVTTWVRPVVQALRQKLADDRDRVRISVVLSPCPNASGKEAAIAQSYPEVDRVQAAKHFWQFLLWGKTADNWDWRTRGVVVFLGGDQLFSVIIGKRLGYRTVIYAEWETRWHSWIDRFAVMKPDLIDSAPSKHTHKFTVVGDLMAEASGGVRSEERGVRSEQGSRGAGEAGENNYQLPTTNYQLPITHDQSKIELIGLLPGSKAAKLSQGVPLMLAIAEYIHTQRPQTRFVIPVAPTLDVQTLAEFANREKNPIIPLVEGSTAELIPHPSPLLKTASGLVVELWTRSPAYDLLSQCCLCLTTVGANTAELGSLGVPMIVLLPTQQLDAMRAWDGIPGLLVNLPFIGTSMAKVINWLVLQRLGLRSWPNIWAKSEIVPELVGKLQPQTVAELVLDYLQHPEKLEEMRSKLRSVRGQTGAAAKIAQIVYEELK